MALTDLRDKHLTCLADMMLSSMIPGPGNLTGQLKILFVGQTDF